MDIPNPRERALFWEAYRGCAEENKVRPDRSPFYVNWVKDFANFLPEKPLKERSFPLNNDMVQTPLGIQPSVFLAC
jgi:hypothetical protein